MPRRPPASSSGIRSTTAAWLSSASPCPAPSARSEQDQGRDQARARRLSAAHRSRTGLDADKAEFSSTYVDALEAFGGREAFGRLRSEDAGWVDGRVLRQMYDEMIQLYRRGGDAYIAFTGPLWAVASLECGSTP